MKYLWIENRSIKVPQHETRVWLVGLLRKFQLYFRSVSMSKNRSDEMKGLQQSTIKIKRIISYLRNGKKGYETVHQQQEWWNKEGKMEKKKEEKENSGREETFVDRKP